MICLFCFDLFVVRVVVCFVWFGFVLCLSAVVCHCCGLGDSLLCLCVLLVLFLFAVVFVYFVVLGGVVCVLPFGRRSVVVCDWRLLILLELVVPVEACAAIVVEICIYLFRWLFILIKRKQFCGQGGQSSEKTGLRKAFWRGEFCFFFNRKKSS